MNEDLLLTGAGALRKIALNKEAKDFILSNDVLYKTLKKAADRYIGGETLEETILKVKDQNRQDFKCSLEFMGENTLTEKEANLSAEEFITIVQQIKKQNLNSTLSLDLSHIGLAVSQELCLQNLVSICQEAQKNNIEVTISAEGVERTDAILDTYKTAARTYSNLSVTLQAYLHRSEDDFKELLKHKGRIRIVKGAFKTPRGLSLQRGKQLDERYLYFVDQLLSENHKCSIATHHHEIQQQTLKLIQHYKADAENYEFESLYGIQTGQLKRLKEQGHPAKLYFVYGREWYLYLCNRIAEHPMNLFQALHDIAG